MPIAQLRLLKKESGHLGLSHLILDSTTAFCHENTSSVGGKCCGGGGGVSNMDGCPSPAGTENGVRL